LLTRQEQSNNNYKEYNFIKKNQKIENGLEILRSYLLFERVEIFSKEIVTLRE
jgi:hypothetical protein